MSFNFDLSYSNPHSNSSLYSGFGLNTQHQHHQLTTLSSMFDKEDLFFSDEDENDPKPRLPLFGRCPLTNRAFLDTTHTPNRKNPPNFHLRSQENDMVQQHRSKIMSDISNVTNRIPLLQISNQRCNVDMNNMNKPISPKKISWSQIAKKPATETYPPVSRPLPTFEEAKPLPVKKPLAASKPSLDEVKDDSLVAMTNKHGKGKYWFKSGCPTPDPRWCSKQQLMIGPIPGDVEYATLRSAFLSKGRSRKAMM